MDFVRDSDWQAQSFLSPVLLRDSYKSCRTKPPDPFIVLLGKLLFRLVKGADRLCARLPSIGRFQPLRGSFSAYDRLTKGGLEGQVLFENQTTGPCPPDSITRRCGMSQHDNQPWPVFWTVTDQARLVGGLRRWRDGQDRVCAEGCYHLFERRRLGEDRLLAQILVPSPEVLSGAWTSIISNWGNGRNYFHWVTDCLTRLLIWEQLPERPRILIPSIQSPFIRETLELLGIQDVCEIREEGCLAPERFYFCAPLAMTGVWNPLGYDWLRQRFARHFLPPSSGNPLFFTRRSKTRIPDQLARIEETFTSAGFDVVDCGKMTVRAQIEAASAAPAIAGIHGAAMTNLLWARPGTPVLEIFQPSYLNACYEQIGFQGRLRYTSLILEGDDPVAAIGAWLRDLGHLIDSLELKPH